MGKVCKKHAEHPVKIYSQCIGCELERMTDELRNAKETSKMWQAEAVVQKRSADKLIEALREIDTHVRSTSDPVPHIIETLKSVLPEYKYD